MSNLGVECHSNGSGVQERRDKDVINSRRIAGRFIGPHHPMFQTESSKAKCMMPFLRYKKELGDDPSGSFPLWNPQTEAPMIEYLQTCSC